MGLVSSLRTALGYGPRPDALASPWTDVQLAQIVYSDVFGGIAPQPLSRLEAMGIPALAKARNLICSTIAKLPLRVLNAKGVLSDTDQPAWTYRTDSSVSPFLRMLWTLDDMLFHGACLWAVDRGSEGQILNAERVPWEWWTVTAEGAIAIHGEVVQNSLELYRSAITHKTNETIRVLTVVSTPLLVLTFLTGLYGMNVPLPFAHSERAFLGIAAVSAALFLGMLAWFRRKRWF